MKKMKNKKNNKGGSFLLFNLAINIVPERTEVAWPTLYSHPTKPNHYS